MKICQSVDNQKANLIFITISELLLIPDPLLYIPKEDLKFFD